MQFHLVSSPIKSRSNPFRVGVTCLISSRNWAACSKFSSSMALVSFFCSNLEAVGQIRGFARKRLRHLAGVARALVHRLEQAFQTLRRKSCNIPGSRAGPAFLKSACEKPQRGHFDLHAAGWPARFPATRRGRAAGPPGEKPAGRSRPWPWRIPRTNPPSASCHPRSG